MGDPNTATILPVILNNVKDPRAKRSTAKLSPNGTTRNERQRRPFTRARGRPAADALRAGILHFVQNDRLAAQLYAGVSGQVDLLCNRAAFVRARDDGESALRKHTTQRTNRVCLQCASWRKNRVLHLRRERLGSCRRCRSDGPQGHISLATARSGEFANRPLQHHEHDIILDHHVVAL